ncbi:hypothetical protein LCGC14_0468160 [marine sediment metagenome]|uniref:Uncharacterized protein n=1 Tax=marine sediment metagenome TaxID=412755 RepID=A0A0F9SIC8_9ZZZZ|nr:MAG: hypothetical protein Lokiarch_20960 [Candidatus Lokiarchaeum sp. GC14_75]
MYSILYFIESNEEYQKFMDFYAYGKIAQGRIYYLFNEDVHSKDGRVFRAHNKILVAVNFNTALLKLSEAIAKMVEFGLDSDLIVNYYDLTFELDEADDERAKQIVGEDNVIALLNKLDFQFKDGSILSISKLCAGVKELKERMKL